MQSTVQVSPVALVSSPAAATPTMPVELSADLLALVAGGVSPRGGWEVTAAAVSVGTDPSPRGGW